MGIIDKIIKRKEKFIFIIQDMYPLKDGGSILFGQVMHGKIKTDAKLDYCDKEKNLIFQCVLQKINQNQKVVEEASHDGAYTAHYGFYIPYHSKEEYEIGNYLIVK